MFGIYEQPWTLIGLAVIVLFGVLTYRSVVPEKRHAWQWLIPLFIVALAFGADALVKTDTEKINDIISAGMQAVETENFNTMESYLSDDYHDSLHRSKEQLIEHVQRELPKNVVEKCKKTNSLFVFTPNKAHVNLFMQIILSKDSDYAQLYGIGLFSIKLDLVFIKQNDKWLIQNIEIRSANQQPITWSQIK